DKLQAGVEFPRAIADNLTNCDILIALIGKQWLTVSDDQGRRLDNPQDFVRREIEVALAHGKRIIPVLVQDAKMPDAEGLPATIKDLANHTAVSIRDASFERDFDVLVDDILGRPRGWVHRELDRARRIFLVQIASPMVAVSVGAVLILAVWMNVLDIFNLDTYTANTLLATADAIRGPPPESSVMLAAIDKHSEETLGHPFNADNRADWRKLHARLIDRAANAGAEAVVFDLSLDETSAADAVLARAVKRAITPPNSTRSIFGIADYRDGHPGILASLIDAGADWGTLCVVPHGERQYTVPLAVVRGMDKPDSGSCQPTGGPIVSAHLPSLSLSAIRPQEVDTINIDYRNISFDGNPFPEPVPYSNIARQYYAGACQTFVECDDAAMLIVRIREPGYWQDPARRVSYADLLEPGLIGDDRLRDKIILVGVSGLGGDGENTDRYGVYRGFTRSTIYGVELHANAISDLETGEVVSTPGVGLQLFITISMALLGAAVSFFTVTHPRWMRYLVLAGMCLVYTGIAVACASNGLLLNVIYDLLAFFIGHGTVL
ncbi:MAG TPA: CHASE2 domain-containing protein, partial [Gammaproteobacteria bacterium]|nr:CHASE2 domain-containing protein [Gammaproteobacteria bacterium]